MEDTSRQNRALIREIMMSKTVEERFLMCAELYEDAKEFAKVGMPDNLTAEEQQRYIYQRIHGEDFMANE